MDFPGKEAVVFCSVEVIELCDEVFLSIVYPRWGKVRLGSVQLIELCGLIQMVELVDYSDDSHLPIVAF